MYLNTITNENAFHLNLSRMGNQTLENKKQVLNYLKQLDSLPQHIGYNLNLLRTSLDEGMAQPRAVLNIENKIQIEVPSSHKFIRYNNEEITESINELKDSIIKVAKKSFKSKL